MAPASLTGGTYSQNFDALINAGTSSALPSGWEFTETGANANTTYTAGTGSSNAGDTYSFGETGSTERALGGPRPRNWCKSLGLSPGVAGAERPHL